MLPPPLLLSGNYTPGSYLSFGCGFKHSLGLILSYERAASFSLPCLPQSLVPAPAFKPCPLGNPESLKGERAKNQEIKPLSSTTWALYIKG